MLDDLVDALTSVDVLMGLFGGELCEPTRCSSTVPTAVSVVCELC